MAGMRGRTTGRHTAGLTVAAAGVALLAAACSSDPAPAALAPDVPATVALGDLPPPLSPADGVAPVPPTTAPPTTAPPTSAPLVEITGAVGDVVDGNRVLLIGDTAMATLTTRQDGIGCETLADFGWQTQIEAERGRFLAFATDVLDEVAVDTAERWDVIGLMFGHHVDVGPDEFRVALDDLVDRISPRPVLLYTVAPISLDGQLSAEAVALNDEIRAVAAARPNAVLVDWSQAIQDEQDVSLLDDGFVPSSAGMERLVVMTAGVLGDAPGAAEGGCLESVFVDDSAILI